jgi:hypothetical protein
MKIKVKASRCEVGGRIIYPTNFTSTDFPIRVSRYRFGGKSNSPTNFTSTGFPKRVSKCEVGRNIGERYGNCFLPLTLVSTEE